MKKLLVGKPPKTGSSKAFPAKFQRVENALVRRSRAANFLVDLANGMSVAGVARKYELSESTVRQEVRWAENEGLFEKAEDAIAHRLVPLAIDVYENALRKHLETGDYDAAEKLLRGVRLFSNGASPTRAEAAAQADRDAATGDPYDWDNFMAQRKAALTKTLDEHQTGHSTALTLGSGSGSVAELPPVDAEIVRTSDDQAGLPGQDPAEHPGNAHSADADDAVRGNAKADPAGAEREDT